MIDKKYTDKDIISSLQVIATTCNCNECKIRSGKWGTCNCSETTANAALDLINHQKAEIESLRADLKRACAERDAHICTNNFIKSEAYKEFAERIADNLIENGVIAIPETGIGDLSDGYHTFHELYHHRAILFSVICNVFKNRAWKSKKHHDGTMYDGMFIVGIDTPKGQATYHYDIDPYWDIFQVKELSNAPEWDGHTPDEAINRISTLTYDE